VLVDVASGVVLLGGAGACAAATVRRGFSVAPIAFAAALMAAVFEDGLVVACALAVAGTAALVLDRMPGVTLFSWLDAGLCGTAVAALAVALGADAAPAVAAGGAVGALALSRWQPGWALPVAIGGLGGLAAGAVGAPLAAFGLAGASWLREPPAKPGPEFSRVVLVAILIGASTALALLGVGQFTELSAVAVGLAIATVLAGMARAGMTVTERLRESHQKAVTDDLTGLGNRRHLVDRLEAAIESTAARDGSLALLLVDLDGFKELNDTLGHSAGDEVLRQIGPRLAQILREQDTLARLGGDEFAVVLAPGDEATASAAGLRLRAALERSFPVGGIRLHVDASIGIALFPQHARDALGLLQRADVAMYEAKRMRTGHEVYLAARDRHSRDRLLLIGELHSALQAGQLVLH
jgi:diguanylate cyclase (GGDEF)-like protein